MRARLIAAVVFALLAASPAHAQTNAARAACPSPTPSQPRPWLDASLSPECRADLVLAQLPTQADKLAFAKSFTGLSSSQRNTPTIVQRLGLEIGKFSDGPAGPRGGMAWPNPLTIAASFDRDAAVRYGGALAQDFRAMGFDGMYGPVIDMPRSWRFGRMSEGFGEDPYLTSRMAVSEIGAAQDQHLIVMMKHFPAYTQEQGRIGAQPSGYNPAVNEIVSERVLREVYFPPFRAAVEEAHVGEVMCSFPRINGIYACENPLVYQVLKNEWGFDGGVYPDFPDAQRSIIPAINAGLDGGHYETTANLITGVGFIPGPGLEEGLNSGQVSQARLVDMIRRRLMPLFRTGALDHRAVAASDQIGAPQDMALASRLITEGAVLLRNRNGVLPFGSDVHSIALIGAQAGPGAFVVSQGSGYVEPKRFVSVEQGLRTRAGSQVAVTWTRGNYGIQEAPAAPAAMFQTPEGRPGVRAEYFADPSLNFHGAPLAVRDEPSPGLTVAPHEIPNLPAAGRFAVRWTGDFTPTVSGVQQFTLRGAGSARLYINDKLAAQYWRSDFGNVAYASAPMQAGQPARIRLEYTPRDALLLGPLPLPTTFMGGLFGGIVELGWAGPDDRILQAAAAARTADAAVVVVGVRQGEGMDRDTLHLPAGDDALIEAVARANRRTIVLVTSGGPVAMPWLNRVAGVMMMWLPGDNFGTAAAQLLFGDASPGGRLPVTFPASESQGPQTTERSYPGLTDDSGALTDVHFEEGLNIGYRYWDAHGQRPLFPFGYGLSYTSFAMSSGRVTPQADGGAFIDIDVRNTGARAGTEVVQAYLGFPSAAGEPARQLRGFAKIALEPGQLGQVQMRLDRRAFEYWDETARAWQTAPGAYRVFVGASSRDFAFQGQVTPLSSNRPPF